MTVHALGTAATFADRCGTVNFDSWAGRTTAHVRVLGETPKRYRCQFRDGVVKLVPKNAVTMLLPGECITHDAERRT